jgi:hypothetical protein
LGFTTDSNGTPHAEWYDLEKLTSMLTPAKFAILYQQFHAGDFNWFDLPYSSM